MAPILKNLLSRGSKSNSNHSVEETTTEKKSTLDTVVDYLAQENWKGVQVDRENNTLYLGGSGTNGNFRITIHVRTTDDNIIIVFVHSPVKVPQEKRLKVAEFLTRANYGVTIGNFEMDLGDGDVRYKGSIDFADGELTAKMVDRLVAKCAYTMDHYFAGLMKVIYGDFNAVQAVGEVEPEQARGEALLQALASALAVQVLNDEDTSTPASSGVTVEVLEDGEAEEADESEGA